MKNTQFAAGVVISIFLVAFIAGCAGQKAPEPTARNISGPRDRGTVPPTTEPATQPTTEPTQQQQEAQAATNSAASASSSISGASTSASGMNENEDLSQVYGTV